MAKKIKLYRGLKAKDFSHFTPEMFETLSSTWKKILRRRAAGNFAFPEKLNRDVVACADLLRLRRQNFTDNREIARRYARENRGILVTIEVPIKDILVHFIPEFQNFAKRHKHFELVYVVDSETLQTHARAWKLKTSKAAKTSSH
jgi:hypothetical protein